MSSAKPMSSISSASSSTTSRTASSAQRAAVDVVDRPARRGDDDVDAVAQRAELAADRLAAVDRQHPGAELAAVAVHRLGHLHGELAGRHEHEGDRAGRRRSVDELQRRQGEGGRLAGAGGRLPEHVAAGEQLGDGVALDRRRLLVAERGQRREQLRVAGRGRRTSLIGGPPVALEAAGLDLDGLAAAQHPLHVQLGAAPLDGVDERRARRAAGR